MNFKAVIAGMVLLLATQADATLFKATWSGADFGNTATAVGIFDIDTSVLSGEEWAVFFPDDAFKIISVTVSGAESGNGVFDESWFEHAAFYSYGPLDFSKELIGQVMSNDCAFGSQDDDCLGGGSGDFNLFIYNVASRGGLNDLAFNAPNGSDYFTLGADGGFGDQMYLTSFLSAVPEPASWALMLAGFGLAGAALRRQRALSAA